MKRILIVEDDPATRKVLTSILALVEGATVAVACDGADGLAQALEDTPDLLVTDVMMPGLDGLALCQAFRAHPQLRHVAIMMLTARAGHGDKLDGFLGGTDDYVPKPFDPLEVQFRAKALLRRHARATAPAPRPGFAFLPERYAVGTALGEATLTPSEYGILAFLAIRPNVFLKTSAICAGAVPDRPVPLRASTLHTHMMNLRRKVQGLGIRIESFRHGYRLVGPEAEQAP